MAEPLFELENDNGENLHICHAPERRLYVVTHDGTEGAHYEASRRDVEKLAFRLAQWLRWEADQP